MKDTESILTAILQREIKRLRITNAELLGTLRALLLEYSKLTGITGLVEETKTEVYKQVEQAITKAEGKE